MSILQGGDEYAIDSKGRVKVSSRILRILSDGANSSFMLTIGQDGCIIAYPMNEWAEIEKKLKSLNPFDEKVRYFLRKFLMNSEKVGLDAQQRITLPKKLTDQAEITEMVQIIGNMDHIEFWNPQRLREYNAKYDQDYNKISEEVMR